VTNETGQTFEYECEEFVGFDVFETARELWGQDWEIYTVTLDSKILEKVFNPNYLTPIVNKFVQ
jgi:hypothetical protein